jgi:hypothetical protein
MRKCSLKIGALFLAVIMLLGSCAVGEDAGANHDATDAAVSDTSEDTTDLRSLYPEPEVKDFDSYNFRIMSDSGLVFNQTEYFAEEQSGDLINDVIYLRNRTIEDKYNISISFTEDTGMTTTVKKNVMAGDDFCDIFTINATSDIFLYGREKYLYDLNTLASLDLAQPWYDQRIQKDYAVYGKLFCINGDFTIREDLREMSVTYDKKLYTEYNFDNPYEFVNSGTWTLDKMEEMSKMVTKDLNGDGVLDRNDQWGLMTELSAGWYLYLASGDKTIKYEGNSYVVDIGSERMFNIFDKVLTFISDKSLAICMDDGTVKTDLENVWKEATRMFSNDQVLFRTGTFGDTVDLRNMKTDFGILPIPKYEESQDGYYCMVHSDCHPICIPITVEDSERTALIFEALSYESMFTLRPAFYETFLDEKILRDEESTKMIDILFSSKVYDLDWVNGITGLSSVVSSVVQTGNNNLASKTASIQKSAQKKLDKFMSYYIDQ